MATFGITSAASAPPANITDFNSLPLVQLTNWMWTICMPINFALGVFGNVMTIVILHRLQARRSSLDRYFLCLAGSDLCCNIIGVLRWWVGRVTDFRPLGMHDVVCKMGYFILNAAVTWSSWFVVAMVAHRAVSVVWPHRVNLVCTAKTSWAIVVTIVVFFGLAYSHILYGVEASGGYCVIKKEYRNFIVTVFPKIDLFMFSLLPFIFLTISNVVLVVKLRMSVKEAGDQFAASERQQSKRERKVNSITLTAVVVSLSFVALYLPLAVKNLVDYTTVHSEDVKDDEDMAWGYFLQNLFFCIGTFNFSTNFYLYCLTGTRFRREFIYIVTECIFCSMWKKSF